MWGFWLEQRDFDRRYSLKAAKHQGDKLVVLSGQFTVLDEGALVEDTPAPLMQCPKDEMKQFLQALVDMAWQEYRISAGQSQGAGAAQAAHLQDMRALVAKAHDVKLQGVEK